MSLARGFVFSAVIAVALSPVVANATLQDFSGSNGPDPVAGTVVAGDLPQGGSAPGTMFPEFTVSVSNNSGPNSCIIFDSDNPTGGDPDLGSPNQTCPGGGPGIGGGGEVGEPGENCTPRHNLLIVAEDIVDGDANNIVDDPDDEAGGGWIMFDFDFPVIIQNVTIMDIDSESASIELGDNGMMVVTVNATDLGDNSAQEIGLSQYGTVTDMKVNFSSSGAVADVEYMRPPVPTLELSWGEIKAKY